MAIALSPRPIPGFWHSIWLQFKNATRLGWLIESNWTDPFVFAIYTLIRPLSTAFILVFMYLVVVQGSTSHPFFAHMYLGNAFFMYVGRVMMGISYAIIDDREHYEMLKYIYISPLKIFVFLMGRGMAQTLTTTFSVLITVLLGIWPLKIALSLSQIDLGLFLLSFFLGLLAIMLLGFLLAGICLVLARHAWAIAEAVAAVLYLLAGAVFPIDVLPSWLQVISRSLPLTYWLELIRRSLLGSSFSRALAGFNNGELLLWLVVSIAALVLISFAVFRSAEGIAKRRGLIDQISGY